MKQKLEDFLKGHKPRHEKPKTKKPLKIVKSVSEIDRGEEYDVRWVANYYGVHIQTLYRWIEKGVIDCDYDEATDGRKCNIRFRPQHIAERNEKRKHG